MPAVIDRRLLRTVTAILLAWIAVDLAALDTCALHRGQGPISARSVVSAPPAGGGPAHSHTALHPDHCFCRAVSTGAAHALPAEPRRPAEIVLEPPPGHPLHVPAALYHPPQLHA